MTSPADLFALQEVDLQRDARRAIIADIDARLGETDELVEAREAVEDAEAALQRLQKRQREVDAALEDLDAKIRPVETRLYDGSVRNPKELTDLQRELNTQKQRRNALDDQGLELIDKVEAATAALEEARAALRRIEATWQAEQESLQADKQKAESEVMALQDQRDQRTKGMDAGALGLYENLRASKQGRAVAPVFRGSCQGCRITLPTHLVQRLRTGDALVQCPSCERILVAG